MHFSFSKDYVFMKPLARKDDLVVEALESEIVVYDKKSHRARCLDPTLAFVWQNCDGKTGIEELAQRVARQFALPADAAIVLFALEELEKAELLQQRPGNASTPVAPSRRELARRLAFAGASAAALLPVLTSIVAPTPAMARSGECYIDRSGRDGGHVDHRTRR